MTARTRKNRIVVIEPSPVIQQGLKTLMEYSSEYEVTECYNDFQAFEEKMNKNSFQIILINPAILNFYKQFSIRNLLADYDNMIIIALLYSYVDNETLSSFDGVLDIYCDSQQLMRKINEIVKTTKNNYDKDKKINIELSKREKDILVLIAKGMTNKEIADKLFISVHTVIAHRKNITQKTNIKTVSGLTLYALFNNLISQKDI